MYNIYYKILYIVYNIYIYINIYLYIIYYIMLYYYKCPDIIYIQIILIKEKLQICNDSEFHI